ncbi:MAG: DNA cytosine methyltransferase, partial [Candidatus Diapherotrites archaeon]|nr:DNA cytosine methyltransferase [Candidatus Diapherotrites archaeon]
VELGYWEAQSYKLNFPEAHVWNEDIRNIHADDVEEKIGRPDVVIGGPPCEAYTSANASRQREPLMRLYEDPRGRLTLHFIRLVGDLQPEAFVMENVVGIIEGDLKEALRHEFGRVGFEVKFHVFDAEDAGVPSHRRRVFVSNVKLKIRKRKPPVVLDAIGDLIELDEAVPNHRPAALSAKYEKKAEKLRWGQALTYFRGASRTIRNYIKLHPFRLAPTIMGSSRFIHPLELRLLTPREHARLMSFPDDHLFVGPLTDQYNMSGEAVPPLLAQDLAWSLRRKLGEL